MRFLFLILLFACQAHKPSNDKVPVMDSPIGTSMIIVKANDSPAVIPAPCDTMKFIIDSLNRRLTVSMVKVEGIRRYLAMANKNPNKYRSSLFDSLSKACNLTTSNFVTLIKPNDCIGLRSLRDSVRIALTRANMKVIRMNFYVRLSVSNPRKYNPFLRGWGNSLFVNQ